MKGSLSTSQLASKGGKLDQSTEAVKIIAKILSLTSEVNLLELEALCRDSLLCYNEHAILNKYNANKSTTKKSNDNKVIEMFISGLTPPFTPAQAKNQALRFGIDDATKLSQNNRGAWAPSFPSKGLFSVLNNTTAGSNDSREYEDVTSPEILNAPICDLCIVQRGEAVPDGFYRISKTLSNRRANINTGSGGNNLFLCIKKDLTGESAPVVAITVFFPDKNEFVPPSYVPVKQGKHACNLNYGTSAERIFLAYKRDKHGNPITDAQIFFPGKHESVPKNFYLVDKSPSGITANLNMGTSGVKIMLCYRQILVRLECLKNEPSNENIGRDSPIRIATGKSMIPRNRTASSAVNTPTTNDKPGPILKANSLNDVELSSLSLSAAASMHLGSPSDSLSNLKRIDSIDDPSDQKIESSEMAADAESVDLEPDDSDNLDEYTEFETTSQYNANYSNNARMTQVVVDADGHYVPQSSRKALHAILTALYAHHDPLSNLAFTGLNTLLKDTDFFEHDLSSIPHSGSVTMLDIMIEAVCDRLDICSDKSHESILQFLRTLIRYLSGRFTSPSLQRVYRSIMYLVGYYSTRSSWMFIAPYLPVNENCADLTTLKVFKELITTNVANLEVVDVAYRLPTGNDAIGDDISSADAPELASSPSIVSSVLNDLVEDTIDSIEISKIVDSVALMISKQTSAISSSVYWEQIRTYARKLFSDSSYRRVFMILCSLCKSSWQSIRMIPKTENPNARDLGTKLIALEAMLEFCRSSGEKMKLSKVMGYVIRRLLVPCLLFNVPYALTDHRVFSKILKIITALWKVWRGHIRIEFAILCEYLMTKILQASHLAIKPIFQLIVLQEVVTWFDQPSLILEMFVNYDLDSRFVSHWNVFSYLIRAVCTIARRSSNTTSAWNWRQLGNDMNDNQYGVTFRDVHLCALEEVASISKSLMDATGHAFLIQQDSSFRSRTLANGLGWEDDYYDPSSPSRKLRGSHEVPLPQAEDEPDSPENFPSLRNLGDAADAVSPASPLTPNITPFTTPRVEGSEKEQRDRPRPKRQSTMRTRRAAHQESENLIQQAIEIYKQKASIKKAVEFLVSKQFMPNTPQEVASFLRVYKNHFDPTAIGEFLGEGGITPEQQEYWSQIRFRYIRAVTFIDLDLEPALRILLTESGFRLPGEAQKINRMVEVFVKAFWQDNHGTIYCPFSHPDTVHLITYAIIMLNTELHRLHRDSRNKKKLKKMTKEEFISNLRGADRGQDIDSEYLGRIYDNIKEFPIELQYESQETNHNMGTPTTTSTAAAITSAIQGAIAPVTSSLSIHHISESKENLPATVAVDIANNPAGIGASGLLNKPKDFIKIDEKSFMRDLIRGLRDAEDLLRTLSPYTYHFQFTGIDTNISLDLVSFMYDTVWFHFHAITDALLVATQTGNDMTITFAALEILSHSLTSSIFLDLKVEKMTFATHLLEFRALIEPKANLLVSQYLSKDDEWFDEVEAVTPESALETVSKILQLIVSIKDAIQESNNYEITRQVANKIEKKAKVLEQNRFFVREGDLTKRNRSGRLSPYHFFLFSDHLIYAHLAMNGEYRVHEQLPLILMTVSEVEQDPSGCQFYINHPTKSFLVVAENASSRIAWVHDLHEAIQNCKRRLEASQQHTPLHRRMSIIGRIHDQHEIQIKHKESMQKALNAGNSNHDHRSLLSTPSDHSSAPTSTTHHHRAKALAIIDGDIDDHIPSFTPTGTQTPTRVYSASDEMYDSDLEPPSPTEKEHASSSIAEEDHHAKKVDRISLFRDTVASLDDRSIAALFEKVSSSVAPPLLS
jgi:hypothetical protein